jgi:hypothetical protein
MPGSASPDYHESRCSDGDDSRIHADLLTKPAFANLATLNPDGSPQVAGLGRHVAAAM